MRIDLRKPLNKPLPRAEIPWTTSISAARPDPVQVRVTQRAREMRNGRGVEVMRWGEPGQPAYCEVADVTGQAFRSSGAGNVVLVGSNE